VELVVKYVLAATALRAFSAAPPARHVYRLLGNRVGQRRRIHAGLEPHYVTRAKTILGWCGQYDAVQPGDRLLEIGTGWVHWEATVLRLVYDADITLFDVWDNRQLLAYKRYCQQLDDLVDTELGLTREQARHAHSVLEIVARGTSFDDIYSGLGFRYIVCPSGTLAHFPEQTFALVFSANVMEHIDRDLLPGFVRGMYRLLRPGGYSMQWIDISDHLANYDPSVCRKQYLTYSEQDWRRFFANQVQYINRVQQPEWREYFEQAGFSLVQQGSLPTDISRITIAPDYARFSREELECNTWLAIHRRNPAGPADDD
jgi:SAM-dependent methyltransferase